MNLGYPDMPGAASAAAVNVRCPCQELGVPAFVVSGPTTPDLRHTDPFAVDRVAKTFPKLPLIYCYGFDPNVTETLPVAFRNENVFISPGKDTLSPGGRLM